MMASFTYYFRTTVRNGYNTVLLDEIYVNLRILTYIKKWDVPCLVLKEESNQIGFDWQYCNSLDSVKNLLTYQL